MLRPEVAMARSHVVAVLQALFVTFLWSTSWVLIKLGLEAKDRENARLLSELKRQAREDALTGLPNRRSNSERLVAAFAQAARQERPLAVALADVDDFKAVNGRFSHGRRAGGVSHNEQSPRLTKHKSETCQAHESS